VIVRRAGNQQGMRQRQRLVSGILMSTQKVTVLNIPGERAGMAWKGADRAGVCTVMAVVAMKEVAGGVGTWLPPTRSFHG
jgi:hypothetical protein